MASDKLLLQTGDFLLLNTGDKLLLAAQVDTLIATAGAYTDTGYLVNFNINNSPLVGSYSLTGYPTTLDVSRVLPIFPELLVILPDESRFI